MISTPTFKLAKTATDEATRLSRVRQLPKSVENRHTLTLLCRFSVWVLLVMNNITCARSASIENRHSWLAEQLEKRLRLQKSINSYVAAEHKLIPSEGEQRQLQAYVKTSQPKEGQQVYSYEMPQRVRIAPFDLLLAPTPIQLQRADEDLLLVDLQELIILFMRTQFGHQGSITTRNGVGTTLEYVLFSDIEENSWSEGGKKHQGPPRTVLRLNGGVASFLGPDVPSEDEVNAWVQSAIDSLLVAAMAETPYNYIEVSTYMPITDSSTMVHSGDIVVAVPSTTTLAPAPAPGPVPLQQAAKSPPDADKQPKQKEGFSLFYVLVSLLIVIGIVSVILALWIRHNNRAVRVLCMSDKEQEEIVDFSTNDSPISITHESGRTSLGGRCVKDEESSHRLKRDSLITMDSSTSSLHHQSSLATNGTIDEASSMQSTTSEFTIPTVSALSFRNPNPFGKSLVVQESFQKERKTYISKDMLYSSWSGAPNLDLRYGRRHDDSVLQPSYFSAAKEWEHLANISATNKPESQLDAEDSIESNGVGAEPQGFRFEAATERAGVEDAPDGIYVVGRSTMRGKNPPSSIV